MLTAVTGINWGDEGKGRVIDLLAEHADVVARYQGGNNAGHTVVTEQGKFILNLLPSGILHPDVVCVLGAGMVIDLDHLAGEMDAIEERGVKVGPENLKLSDKATWYLPAGEQKPNDSVPNFKIMNDAAIALADKECRSEFVSLCVRNIEEMVERVLAIPE